MKAIWKFPLLSTRAEIDMPKGAEILDVQAQHGKGTIWALCDCDAPKEKRVFWTFGTGHSIPFLQPMHYIGTYQSTVFVWHVFELTN